MANFDFTTLSFSDLEDLFCDLLNGEQQLLSTSIRYRTFKDGKDKGIDVLYSSHSHQYDHVGQVKHYLYSGFDAMYNKLETSEVSKVQKLSPNRYLFATSLDLSKGQAESIMALFTPHIKSLTDIYARKDLNDLLDKHPDVLRSQFKLWLGAVEVLNAVINSDIIFRSNDEEKELRRRIRNYVRTPSYDKAMSLLEKNKFVVITGEPGVGKSMLADMLAFSYIQNGYSFTYIIDDIKDVERVLTNDQSKQIIYYNDFLGSNEEEIKKARASETSLLKIVRRISKLGNKILILTTRSHLLTSAIESSENLERIRKKESIITLDEYSIDVKIRLYNNHVEESELKPELQSLLRTSEIRDFIVNHTNFFPRSVEYITTKEQVDDYSVDEFHFYIKNNFDYPDKIYSHAYNKQIEQDDRLLLNTLIGFGALSVDIEVLKKAFQSRIDLEGRKGRHIKVFNAFNRSLSRLDGAFVFIDNDEQTVNFINPSLVDFLVTHIRQDPDELSRIVESACVAMQLARFFLEEHSNIEVPSGLKDQMLTNYQEFVSRDSADADLLVVALVLFRKIPSKESEDVVVKILEEIDDWESLHIDYSLNLRFRDFMNESRASSKVQKVISDKILSILTDLVLGEDDLYDAADLAEQLTNTYEVDLEEVNIEQINDHINALFADYISQELETLQEDLFDTSEADDKQSEIDDLIDRFEELGVSITEDTSSFDAIDWHDVAMDHHIRRVMEKDD